MSVSIKVFAVALLCPLTLAGNTCSTGSPSCVQDEVSLVQLQNTLQSGEQRADPKKGKADPYSASMKAKYGVYGAGIEAKERLAHDQSDAAKAAYVERINDVAKARIEAIAASENAARETMNAKYAAWYDSSPFHAEGERWKHVGEDNKKGKSLLQEQDVTMSKKDFDTYYSNNKEVVDADVRLLEEQEEEEQLTETVKHQDTLLQKALEKISMEEKLNMLKAKLEQQDALLAKVLKAVSAKADPKKKDESAKWHKMDPFLASIVGPAKAYSEKVKKDTRAIHDYNEAWKRAYVDQVQDVSTAQREVIRANHKAYREHLNEMYEAWYDPSPFHAEDKEWDKVGHEEGFDFAHGD